MLDLVFWNLLIPELGRRCPLHEGLVGLLGSKLGEVGIAQLVPLEGILIGTGYGREIAASPTLVRRGVYSTTHSGIVNKPWRCVFRSCVARHILGHHCDQPPISSLRQCKGHIKTNDAGTVHEKLETAHHSDSWRNLPDNDNSIRRIQSSHGQNLSQWQ